MLDQDFPLKLSAICPEQLHFPRQLGFNQGYEFRGSNFRSLQLCLISIRMAPKATKKNRIKGHTPKARMAAKHAKFER